MQANTANERFWQNVDGAVSRNEQKDINATSTKLNFLLIGHLGQSVEHRSTMEKFGTEGREDGGRAVKSSGGKVGENSERRVGDF